MFTGIIEEVGEVLTAEEHNGTLRIEVLRPLGFDDLKLGDSIACNGVCLTLEKCDQRVMQFSLGYESLQTLKWSAQKLIGKKLNLERSMRFGDRVHGHLVSGHVECLGQVFSLNWQGDSLVLDILYPSQLRSCLWKKGAITIDGTSLTVNELKTIDGTSTDEIKNHLSKQDSHYVLSVCLIPETLKRTNLSLLQAGDFVNLESDYFAKSVINYLENRDVSSLIENQG